MSRFDGEARFDFHDRFIFRQTTHPIEWLKRLDCAKSFELIQEIVAVEDGLRNAKENFSACLFAEIPRLTGRNRPLALDFKRFLGSEGFRPIPEKFAALKTELLPETVSAWDGYEGLYARLGALSSEYSSVYESEIELVRGKLREILREPLFVEGVLLSSQDLYEGLLRYLRSAERKEASDSKRQRGFERGIVEHLARAATKPTPRGLLAGVATGSWESQGESPGASPGNKKCRTILEISLVRSIARKIHSTESLRLKIVPRPNPTLQWDEEKFRFLRPIARMDTMLELPKNELLRTFVHLASERTRTAEALIDEVHACFASDLSLEQTRNYYERLVESELLLGELEIPFEEVDGLDFLIRWLEGLESMGGATETDARRWLDLLRPLAADVKAPQKNSEILRSIRSRILAICPDLNEARLKNPIIVDLVLEPAIVKLSETVKHDLERLVWLGTVPDRLLSRRGERSAQEFKKAFDALGIREADWKDSRISLWDLAAKGIHAERAPTRWTTSVSSEPEFERFQSAFRSWLEALEKSDPRQGCSSAPLEIGDEDLKQILGRMDSDLAPLVDGEGSLNFMIAASDADQIRSGKALIVCNEFGRDAVLTASRFLALIDDSSLTETMQKHMEWVSRLNPEKLPVDLACLSSREKTDTAGQVPGFFPRAVECSAVRSGRPSEQLVPIREIIVEKNTDGSCGLRWKNGASEVPIKVFYRSVLNYHLFPPVGRFLSFLGAMTGTSQSEPVKLCTFAPIVAGVIHCPRILLGNLVLARETWRVEFSDLRKLLPGTLSEGFLEMNKWRTRLGLPRFVFVRVPPAKPFYVDFTNPFSLDNLLSMIHRLKDQDGAVDFVEMLPTPEDFWQNDRGFSYASEILIGFRWETE